MVPIPADQIAKPLAGSYVRGFVKWEASRPAALRGWQWDWREERWLECAAINLEHAARLERECRASAARRNAPPIWAEAAAEWAAWKAFFLALAIELAQPAAEQREAA